MDCSSAPAPSQQALGQASSSHLSWASCSSPPASEPQIPPAHRPRSNSSSGPVLSRPSPLSQSAPSSFWQIHTEHLYQVRAAVMLSDSIYFIPLINKLIKCGARAASQKKINKVEFSFFDTCRVAPPARKHLLYLYHIKYDYSID